MDALEFVHSRFTQKCRRRLTTASILARRGIQTCASTSRANIAGDNSGGGACGCIAHCADRFVPGVAQRRDDARTNEAVRTGHQHAHGQR